MAVGREVLLVGSSEGVGASFVLFFMEVDGRIVYL